MIRKLTLFSSAAVVTLGGLVLAASTSQAATPVVNCAPTAGLASVATVNPPQVNNVSPDDKFGIQLKTRIDGCVANAAQLAAWAPSKLGGTINGALIAKADVQLKTKGFGTCNFAAPDAGAYPATGSLKIKWLDAAGATVAKATPTQASVRLNGDLGTASAVLQGIATKGIGMGADVFARIGFDLANPVNGPVLACNTGPYSGPAVSQIGLITDANSVLDVSFP